MNRRKPLWKRVPEFIIKSLYSFSSLEAGKYTLEVNKSGYVPFSTSIFLPADTNSRKNVRLAPASGGNKIRVTDISCRYPGEVVFLEGMDLNVEFTANLDWAGHLPRKVVFQTSYNTYEVNASGSNASMEFNIGEELTLMVF